MRKNIIRFTNMGTVRFNGIELTNDYFFSKMEKDITISPQTYLVSSDYLNKEYTIILGGQEYSVVFEKDGYLAKKSIMESLNKLVSTRNNAKTRTYEDNSNEIYKDAREYIIKNNDTRKEELRDESLRYEREKYHIFENVWKTFKKFNIAEKRGTGKGLSLLILVLSLVFRIFASGIGVANSLAQTIYSISLCNFNMLNWWLDDTKYRGIWASIVSVLALPFTFIYHVFKKLENFVDHCRLVDNCKKQIIGKEKDVQKTKADVNEINNILNDVNTNYLNNESVNLRTTLDKINSLRNKILSIKDKETNMKYTKELLELVSYYIDSATKIKKQSLEFLNKQLDNLSKRIDEENKKDDSFEEETVFQKSIGAR